MGPALTATPSPPSPVSSSTPPQQPVTSASPVPQVSTSPSVVSLNDNSTAQMEMISQHLANQLSILQSQNSENGSNGYLPTI
jgi:hypothetical protein